MTTAVSATAARRDGPGGRPGVCLRCGLLLLVSLWLAACAGDPPQALTPAGRPAKAVKSKPAPPAVPPEVSNALLPPLRIGPGREAPGARGQRFDVSAVKLPARQFFVSLVSGTPYEVVVHPGVTGTISLHMTHVTVRQVLRVVRDIYGYEYERDGDLLKVFPPRLHSRVFQVSYLDVKRTGASAMAVTPGGSGGGEAANSALSAASAGTVTTTTEADFWRDLKAALVNIVGDGSGRTVTVSPGVGLVIVHAYPAELRRVQRFLHAIQRVAHRTVMFEGKVLEVRLNDRSWSGIDWAALEAPAGNGAGAMAKSGRAARAGGAPGVFSLALSRHDFAPLIRSLGRQGRVRVLSSPRFSTLNNQKAVIKVGTDEFFVTHVSSPPQGITLTPFFSGIALAVTPQIDGEGDVMLHIHPAVSDVRDQTKTFTVADKEERLPLALSSIREADMVIRTGNGQVVMIGGLMQERRVPRERTVPVLGAIPLLGRLFRHTDEVETKSELIILLRPTVVGAPVRE